MPARIASQEACTGEAGDGSPGQLHQLQHVEVELIDHDAVDATHLLGG